MRKWLQMIAAGRLEAVAARQRALLHSRDILRRFWAKDLSLWTVDDSQLDSIRSNLAWVDLPEAIEPLLDEIARARDASLRDGLYHWVFLALGSSSLTARALLPVVTLQSPWLFSVLDSSHPSAIRNLEEKIDPVHTGFILSSKAGDKLEDHALFLYFQELLRSVPTTDVSQHFASATEDNSFLSGISHGNTFRATFLDPPHILPSYCSIHHFGALLTGLSVVDSKIALSSIRAMRQSCMNHSEVNFALDLGVFLSSAAVSSCRYLIFLSSPSLTAYSNCLGHLLGGSLAKEGCELVPVTGDVPHPSERMEKSAAFVFLTWADECDAELEQKMRAFRAAGVPFVWVQIASVADLLPETFKWEIATALACANLGVNPFEWPDVRQPRRIAMELLDKRRTDENALKRKPRLQESGIQLFAEGRTRAEISTLNLLESMRSFFRLGEENGCVVLLVFLERTAKVENSVRQFRELLTKRLDVPVLVHYGPRCFDQYAFLCRSELSQTQYIVLTADYSVDQAIPGAQYTFSELHTALVLGEFESLVRAGRSVIRLNLLGNLGESLTNLKHLFDRALRAPL